MYTLEDLEAEIAVIYASVNEVQWTTMINEQGISTYTIPELQGLVNNYVDDINQVRQMLRVDGMQCTIVPFTEAGVEKTQNVIISEMHDFFDEIDATKADEDSKIESLACCLKQIERLEA